MAVTDDPAQPHLPSVCNCERDQHNDEGDEHERPGVQPGTVAVATEPVILRLDRLG